MVELKSARHLVDACVLSETNNSILNWRKETHSSLFIPHSAILKNFLKLFSLILFWIMCVAIGVLRQLATFSILITKSLLWTWWGKHFWRKNTYRGFKKVKKEVLTPFHQKPCAASLHFFHYRLSTFQQEEYDKNIEKLQVKFWKEIINFRKQARN